MTNYDNSYYVIPMLDMRTGKEVYQVLRLDGYSYPEAGTYSTKEAAQKVADAMNKDKAE